MMHSNSDRLEHTVRPCLAMALCPVMMANPFYAIYAGLSGAAYVVDQMNSFTSVFLSKSKENPSLRRDGEPTKLVERSKLQLVAPLASKDAGRAAGARKANSPKRTHHKG
jgi:hypothetical protein